MTLIPAGAQLAPTDLPPPPPSADPREPSPSVSRGRSSRTPVRARSPAAGHRSRQSSPSRPSAQHQTSTASAASAASASSDASLPIMQPKPVSASSLANPLHSAAHLSRPSSPSSFCSSTSAIFERDIELPAVASLSINPHPPAQHTLTHKPSRLSQFPHGSPLDHTVPAVLDHAVEALQGTHVTQRGLEGLEIEAPATGGGTTMARQSSASLHHVNSNPGRLGSTGPGGVLNLGSRSPSPVSMASRSSGVISPAISPPILGQLAQQQQPQHQQHQHQQQPLNDTSDAGSPTKTADMLGSVPRPGMPGRISTGPMLSGGWAFGHGSNEKTTEADVAESPAAVESDKSVSPPTLPANSPPILPAHSPSPPPALPSHMTPSKENRRISFVSYNDLLLSVPTTVTPLGEITSGNLSPDHLPGAVSPSPISRSPVVPSTASNPASATSPRDEMRQGWDAGTSGRAGGLGLGEGEWERQGLGQGLEQRLENLAREDSGTGAVSPPAR